MDKICENGICRYMTQEEVAKMQADVEEAEREYWATISYKQAVINEIHKKYDNDDENAILRQKEEKPDEFQEYYNYCEECKRFVKEKLSMGGVQA